MINKKNVIGLILARGGSKGLKDKNIKIMNGKPLLAWSIIAGLNSNYIDDLIVSTDSEEISKIAEEYGAEVPFIRPSELSADQTSSPEVIFHALHWLLESNRRYEYVILLQPTSPLRESCDIDEALEMLDSNSSKSVVSVSEVEGLHPSYLFKLESDRHMKPISGVYPNKLRRQDLEKLFYVNGAIYCSSVNTFFNNQGFYHENTIAYNMPKWKSFDVDDICDFILIEAIMKSNHFKKQSESN